MEDKKTNTPVANEVSDDLLEQVTGGSEETQEEVETQAFYCARDCKCKREFRRSHDGYWICTVCGLARGSINVFA